MFNARGQTGHPLMDHADRLEAAAKSRKMRQLYGSDLHLSDRMLRDIGLIS